MLLHIIRKELLDQLLSLRFAVACVVCVVVFLLSFTVLARDYREAMSTYNMNTVMHRSEVQQVSQVWQVGQNVKADRPLNPLSTLVRGAAPELTETVQVQRGGRLDFAEAYEQNPVIPLFPAVDAVFIVGTIMSLLALAFAYDSVSGESESGVLKLLMSYAVPRDLVLVGKWVGGYLALVAPFVAAYLIALVGVALFPQVELDLASAGALVGVLGLSLLYLAAVFSLGLLVSCRTRTPTTSITVLLLLWVALVLALPNMAPYAAQVVSPVPQRGSVDREKEVLGQEYSRRFQSLWEEQREAGGQQPADQEEWRAKFEAMRKEMEEALQKIEDGYAARVKVQTRWAGLVARLSPVTSYKLAALDLAAAGVEQERRFVEALKAYGTAWNTYAEEKSRPLNEFVQRRQRESRGGNVTWTQADFDQFNKDLDLGDHPRFRFRYMGFRERLSLVYPDLLLLLLWNVVFFMLAYLSFVRAEIR
ncbi:MAG: ABC transporter permease subunit [Candidatus Latescibacterota bacterium]